MFLSGAGKLLSGDANWRNWTALNYHYLTQPLPTPIAWYVAQLPEGFQKFSVGMVFCIELGVPFLIFMPRRLRMLAAGIIVFFQALIFLTGNYTFFNLLAMALCVFLLDDAALRRFWPKRFSESRPTASTERRASLLPRLILISLAGLIVFVSGFQIIGTFEGVIPRPARRVMTPSKVSHSPTRPPGDELD